MNEKHIYPRWIVPANIDTTGFNFNWRPPRYDPPYIHQFGTQHQKTGGPRWIEPGATDVKYHDTQIATAIPNDNWVIPEGIDTTGFDWSWHPDSTEEPYIYEFGTQWQRTGGPRYIVPGATQTKYVDTQRVIALPHDGWIIPEEILNLSASVVDFDRSWHPDSTDSPSIYAWGNQWRTASETPTILYRTPGATKFKYMDDRVAQLKMPPLDVVFVSNGEVGAEDRYLRLAEHAKKYGNTVHWINGVDGRENALYQAALVSKTKWWWCIPAKLWVDDGFDLGWHPNPWIEPTHWITHAVNPLNGLVYGHQAAVCYYRQHIIDTYEKNSWGLDFTMSAPHDIHPVVSGVAQYNSDPWTTWRTAFRETIKLKLQSSQKSADLESVANLNIWLNVAHGLNKEWSLLGANDAIDYYQSVCGNVEALKKSFYWEWLISFARGKGYVF